MALHDLQVRELRAAHAEELVMHRHEMLADDRKLRGRQQMVDVGDAAGQGVLDRDHARSASPEVDRLEAILEGRLRHRLAIGKDLQAGDVGVGARLALEDHARLRQSALPYLPSPSTARARSRSAGVSTPNGTSSMSVTSIRMPASSARNCSRRSRFSRGSAAAPRSARAPRDDRRRCRCGGRAAPRPRARWRA